jgi:hypothetical protein
MNTKLTAAMAVAMTFAGCASTPTTNPALDNARTPFGPPTQTRM